MKVRVALYDFDDTLIHGDSGVLLIKYYLKKHPFSFWRLFLIPLYYIPYLLEIIPINKAKTAWLFPLKKMSEAEVRDFYHCMIKPKLYSNVVDTLIKHKQDGYLVYICSASVEAYLRFCDLPVDKIIGTRTKDYSNVMIGNNCRSSEKVNRIMEALQQAGYEIDYDNSYAYSDSLADIPMMKMVKNRIRISKEDGSMSKFIF